jgi:hypothetical protein
VSRQCLTDASLCFNRHFRSFRIIGVQAGAIFVDAAAKKYLQSVLTNASLAHEDIDDFTTRGVKDFESAAKRNFRDSGEEKSVEIAGPRFNNSFIRTRRGRMTLPG